MATKELTLRKKGKAKAPVKAPSKRTMNFVHHKKLFNARRMLPLLLALVVITGCFIKFGILDPMAKKQRAYADLAAKQEYLQELYGLLSDYREVELEYGRYSEIWMDEKEKTLVDRMDALELVVQEIAPKAGIENLAINGNALTMNIWGLTLEQASTMVEKLEQRELVDSAYVYTAVAEEAEQADIFLSINLTKEAE